MRCTADNKVRRRLAGFSAARVIKGISRDFFCIYHDLYSEMCMPMRSRARHRT